MFFLSELTRVCVFFFFTPVRLRAETSFHYPGLQVDGCSRGRGVAGKTQAYRCMCTAMSRLLQAARSCTHTSMPSLVTGIF